MSSPFTYSRRGVIVGVCALAPIVLASACSDSPSSFFDQPMGGSGKGGRSSNGGSSAAAGSTSSGGASAGKTGNTGGVSGGGGSSAGGTGGDASGGTGGGTGGDGPTAGSGGTDPGTGGSAGNDAMGGEGGVGEGGMGGGGASGGAESGGTAGTAGTGGTAGAGGTAGTGGTGGTGGTAGTSSGGTGGTAGNGGAGTGGVAGTAGTNTGGTGGASCVPKTEICDGVDNDCGKDIDEDDVCPSGCHGGTLDGRTFLLCTSNSELDWTEARDFCRDVDSSSGDVAVAGPMTLAEIRSADENQFFVDWIKEREIDENVWHGANDRSAEGQWVWDRGSGNTAKLFFTVSMFGVRMAVDGAYNDWPSLQPSYNGSDCGMFDVDLDFRWDDASCSQSLGAFACSEIP
jgi:hypothetical protein